MLYLVLYEDTTHLEPTLIVAQSDVTAEQAHDIAQEIANEGSFVFIAQKTTSVYPSTSLPSPSVSSPANRRAMQRFCGLQ